MLSLFSPHETYQAANRHKDMFKTLDEFDRYRPPNFFDSDLTDKPAWVSQIGKPDVDYVDKVYERMLRSLMSVDDAVGTLTSILDKQHIRDNTLIVFMSDNGMSLGDNAVFGKNCPYDACLRVPMIVSYPPLTSTPRVDERSVLNIDLAPTFLDLAGIASPQHFDGQSFLPLLGNPSGQWRDEICKSSTMRTLRTLKKADCPPSFPVTLVSVRPIGSMFSMIRESRNYMISGPIHMR